MIQKVASCCRRTNQVSYKYSKVGRFSRAILSRPNLNSISRGPLLKCGKDLVFSRVRLMQLTSEHQEAHHHHHHRTVMVVADVAAHAKRTKINEQRR